MMMLMMLTTSDDVSSPRHGRRARVRERQPSNGGAQVRFEVHFEVYLRSIFRLKMD